MVRPYSGNYDPRRGRRRPPRREAPARHATRAPGVRERRREARGGRLRGARGPRPLPRAAARARADLADGPVPPVDRDRRLPQGRRRRPPDRPRRADRGRPRPAVQQPAREDEDVSDDERDDRAGEFIRPASDDTEEEASRPLATEDEERDDPEQGFGQL